MEERFVDYLRLFLCILLYIVTFIPAVAYTLIAQIIRHIIKAFCQTIAMTRTMIGYCCSNIADYINDTEYSISYEEFIKKEMEDAEYR